MPSTTTGSSGPRRQTRVSTPCSRRRSTRRTRPPTPASRARIAAYSPPPSQASVLDWPPSPRRQACRGCMREFTIDSTWRQDLRWAVGLPRSRLRRTWTRSPRAPSSGDGRSLVHRTKTASLLGSPFESGLSSLDSTLNAELLGVLRVQSLPASELHRRGTNDAADGGSAEQVIQNIEAKVPPGSTHRDEAAIDVGPQRQARAATNGFELPPHIEATPVVLEHLGSVGSGHCCFGDVRRGRSHRGELHRGSNRTQAPIGVEGRPLAQLRRVGKRLPDGRTRCVLLAIGHLVLLRVPAV